MKKELLESRMEFRYPRAFQVFYFHLRWIAPGTLILVFLSGLQRVMAATCSSSEVSMLCVRSSNNAGCGEVVNSSKEKVGGRESVL